MIIHSQLVEIAAELASAQTKVKEVEEVSQLIHSIQVTVMIRVRHKVVALEDLK